MKWQTKWKLRIRWTKIHWTIFKRKVFGLCGVGISLLFARLLHLHFFTVLLWFAFSIQFKYLLFCNLFLYIIILPINETTRLIKSGLKHPLGFFFCPKISKHLKYVEISYVKVKTTIISRMILKFFFIWIYKIFDAKNRRINRHLNSKWKVKMYVEK